MKLDLRRERERRGLDLDEIAELTRIPLRYLVALEDDDTIVLPHGPFRRGYLRQYLDALGIAPDELEASAAVGASHGVDLEHPEEDDLQPVEHTQTTSTIPRGDELPVLRLVMTGFVLTLAIVLGLKVGSEFIDPVASAGADALALQPQALTVRAVEPTHVRVVVDGRVAEDGDLDPGETVEVKGQARIELDAADLTALVVYHNDERIEPLHNLSHQRRLVFVQDPAE